jgi:pyruvate ferredoxin oxidoreductase beta subunit
MSNVKTLQKLRNAGELFMPGHRACIGCGEVLAMRQVCKALGKDIIIANATGCMEIISSPFPTTNWDVPWIHALFENTAAVASGVESGLDAMRRKGKGPSQDVTVVAMGGDGSTFDIGLQSLSGALERGHNFIYVCFDNEGYMNTGIQRSSATPFGASTTTSPVGKNSIGQTTQKKDMPLIALAHHIPYIATCTPAHPTDLAKKIKKAKEIKGPAYIHVFSPCPTGWGTDSDLAIELCRLAVDTGVFPLGECVHGTYALTKQIKELKPIRDYMKLQRRFRHLSDDVIDQIQAQVREHYQIVRSKCGVLTN